MHGPFVLIIFGATGDLARSKLIPSLFSLFKQKQLPEGFSIIGFARREFSDEAFAAQFTSLVTQKEWSSFAKHFHYQQGEFGEEKGYLQLIKKLEEIDTKGGSCITRIFYLATPPSHYETILDFLHATKLSEGCGQGSSKWTKVAIEKPFGKDLETARALDKKLATIFEEKQIFRVDHYLGKETLQNMIAFRFANGIFEPVWNNKYIDHVQITWAETKGVERHGEFFDGVGMLRDAGQNHLMQLLAAVAMEQPTSFTKEGVRDARASAIKSLTFKNSIVRGQYQGYTEEEEVVKNSSTETFIALKLFVDTPRFSEVPFYLRAGKKMPKNVVEISIVFIQTCHILFKEFGCPEEGNVLTIRIQPDEGIGLRVIAKKPSFAKASEGKASNKLALGTIDMKFSYQDQFGGKGQDAYERLLMDIFTGDQMLFNRSDELDSSWGLITQILKKWEDEKTSISVYKKSTWGPKEAQDLITRDGKKWL